MLSFSEVRKFLDDQCVKHNVDCKAPRTSARLLDKVGNINSLSTSVDC